LRESNGTEVILAARGLAKHFGGLAAIEGIQIEIKRGSIVGIIGPNGSGKTTLFNVITGYLKATQGEVFYQGEKISGMRPFAIVNKGIARTFQVPQCCKQLTIRENIHLACIRRYPREMIAAKIQEFARMAKIETPLDARATNVPIGYLRKTELAMALATHPRLLLLDEPFSGLTDLECNELAAIIRGLREKISLVVIDHKLKHLMPIVEKVFVLNEGRLFFEGTPEEVSHNPEIQRIYIGGEIKS
jgi:branched-chain amino acid transport system ATP-binding protein